MTRNELLAARTTTWTDDERAALTAVVTALRPSPHHLADVLDWLEDIAVRDGTRPAAVLADARLGAALASRGSAPDRWKRWKETLRRLRYPRLAAREREFHDLARALELGRGVAVAAPAAFEGGTVTITIRAASATELDAALAALDRARQSGGLARLFALLG